MYPLLSALWTGLAAAALSFSAFNLQGEFEPAAGLSAAIGLAVSAVYLADRLARFLSPEDSINQPLPLPGRAGQGLLWLLAAAFGLTAARLSLTYDSLLRLLPVPVLMLALYYALLLYSKYKSAGPGGRSLLFNSLGMNKALLLALVWLYVTTVIPLALSGGAVWGAGSLLLLRGGVLYWNALSSDTLDYRGDLRFNKPTAATVLSLRGVTRFQLGAALIMLTGSALTGLSNEFYIMGFPVLILSFFAYLKPSALVKRQNIIALRFIYDGILLLSLSAYS